MMEAIYTYLMKLVYERSQQKQQSEYIADVPLARFNDRLKLSRRYFVAGAGNGQYQVEIPDSGRKHIVNLNTLDCDCTNFRYYRSPCTHVIAACKYESRDPFEFISEIYTTEALTNTYQCGFR